MEIISAREFRANQTAVLSKALRGESVLLTSRIGTFKITPVAKNDSLTSRICRGLEEVKHIREGKAKSYTIDQLLDEL